MGLPRPFVGFSSTDINYNRTMQMWKAHERIDFDFIDVQLPTALESKNEYDLKAQCRERLKMAGTYMMLIGRHTSQKDRSVRWGSGGRD